MLLSFLLLSSSVFIEKTKYIRIFFFSSFSDATSNFVHIDFIIWLLYNIIVSVWERACDLIWLYLVVASTLCCIYFSSFFSFSTIWLVWRRKKCSQTHLHTQAQALSVWAMYACMSDFVAVGLCVLFVEAKSILLLLIHFIYSEHWKMCSPLIVVSFGVLAICVCVCVCARLRWALVIRAYSYFYSVLTVYLFIFTFFSVVPFCCFDFFFDFLLSFFYFFS